MFPQFFENPSNGIDVGLAWVFNIDDNIIYINNNKNIELSSQDFIDITLETSLYVEKPKNNYLVLEVAISSTEGRILFIALFYPYLIVSTREIELGKLFGST